MRTTTTRRRCGTAVAGLALAVVAAAVAASTVSAAAQTVSPTDSCYGSRHGDNPFGSPSFGRFGLSFPLEYADAAVLLVTDHTDGSGEPSAGVASVDDSGRVFVDVPLYSYGPLAVDYVGLDEGGGIDGQDPATVDRSSLLTVDTSGLGPHVVDDEEAACDPDVIEAGSPAPTPSPSTASTTPSSAVSNPPPTTGTTAPTGGGSSTGPILVGLGVVLAGAGIYMSRSGVRSSVPTTPGEDATGKRSVIFVPGIMATAITATDAGGTAHQVWPPLGHGGDVKRCMETLIAADPTKLAVDQSQTGLLPGIHGKILGFLDSWGYHLSGPKPNLYVYAYNWMEPCSETGKGLAALIARANAEHGRPPTIICHSMGGLVTRAAYHLHGATQIDQAFYFASPHHGAPMAYYALHPAIPYKFVPGMGGRILNAAYAGSATESSVAEFIGNLLTGGTLFDDTMKLVARNAGGVFDLLPDEDYFEHIHPRWNIVMEAYAGREPGTWQETYLGERSHRLPPETHEKVRAAMAFKRSISKPLPPEDGARCFVIYGAKHETPTSALTYDRAPDPDTGEICDDEQGGDGTVPRESGRGEVLWPDGCTVQRDDGAEHFMLTETPTAEAVLRADLPRGDS